MISAMRGVMAGAATMREVLRALAAPMALTVILAPVTLMLYRRR